MGRGTSIATLSLFMFTAAAMLEQPLLSALYPAHAADIKGLLQGFLETRSLRFRDFRALWRDRAFSRIHEVSCQLLDQRHDLPGTVDREREARAKAGRTMSRRCTPRLWVACLLPLEPKSRRLLPAKRNACAALGCVVHALPAL